MVVEGVEFVQEVFFVQFQVVEQFQWVGIDFCWDGLVLVGEFFLYYGIEIDGEVGEEYQVDEVEFEGLVELFVQVGCWVCFVVMGMGGLGMCYGGVLYVFYLQWIDIVLVVFMVCVVLVDRCGGSVVYLIGDLVNGCYLLVRFVLLFFFVIMWVFVYFRGKDIL